MSTINFQVTSSHETASFRYQKNRCPAIFPRLTEFAQHVLRRPVALSLWELLEECFYHCGHDVAWRDGVYANPELSPLRSEIPGELKHTSFRSVVRRADQSLSTG